MSVARDFFPTNVINQLQVNGSQNIAIKVKIYEVSRTKLRKLGVDWSVIDPDLGIVSSVSQVIQSFSLTTGNATGNGNVTVGVINGDTQINAFIDALEVRQVAKLLDEPVLIAQNGRPAEFLSGGEIPIQVASGLGTNAIQFRPFGTKLDIVPIVQGQGQLTLEVRAEVSEIANDLAGETGVPGFRVRRVNTGVKMRAGHTLALAGDYRESVQSEVRGTPKLLDMPIIGTMFRKVQDDANETELVFLITPRFISDVEPHQVPHPSPGQLTTIPSDRELFRNGYLEVPRCQDDCPIYDRFDESNPSSSYPPAFNYQSAQPVKSGDSAQPQNANNHNQFQMSSQQPTNSERAQKTAPREAKAFGGFNWPSLNR
jgi:pilus assembly protein CpaC